MGCWVLGLVLGCAGVSKSGSGEGPGGAADPGDSGSTGNGGRPQHAPPAQGAFIVTLSSAGVSGKTCPSGASSTFDVPSVLATSPAEKLSSMSYQHWAADGDGDSSVACRVQGTSSFTFSGRLQLGVKLLDITDGVIDGRRAGSARITVADGTRLSNSLTSPGADCVVEVVTASSMPQIKNGSMWATFSCASLEHAPSDACAAEGTFVLENCEP
jgi:hypothetical protein